MKSIKYYIIQSAENHNLFLHKTNGYKTIDVAWNFYDLDLATKIAERLKAKLIECQVNYSIISDFSTESADVKRNFVADIKNN